MHDVAIAGNFRLSDWNNLINRHQSGEDVTADIFDVFKKRIQYRYLDPIARISNGDNYLGEGFSIVSLICSMIEALQTARDGKAYFKGAPRGDYENRLELYGDGCSRFIFIKFLKEQDPFSMYFDDDLANDFYANVRCSILHEAMVRNGWRIRVDTNALICKVENFKILNRKLLIESVEDYMKVYKSNFGDCIKLQSNLISKINLLSKNDCELRELNQVSMR